MTIVQFAAAWAMNHKIVAVYTVTRRKRQRNIIINHKILHVNELES